MTVVIYNRLPDLNCLKCVHSTDATIPLPAYGLGRYINHSIVNSNLKGRIEFDANGDMHLCFVALRDIQPNEELFIDYGDRRRDIVKHMTWLKD
jgi:hypothetical protein